MKELFDKIRKKTRKVNGNIVVFSAYDVDAVCATKLLTVDSKAAHQVRKYKLPSVPDNRLHLLRKCFPKTRKTRKSNLLVFD